MVRVALILSVLVPVAAHAATLDITVRNAAGAPLAGAVVTVDSRARPPSPIHFPWPMTMAQHNIAFDPHVLIVPVGATVAFPNLDSVRHHVYSFSKAKKFTLQLYGKDQTRSVTFDQPGVVALGCNIHDSMSGFIVVVDTPYAMKADDAGHVRIPDVPDGPATISVWDPSIRAPGNRLSQATTISGASVVTTLTVRR